MYDLKIPTYCLLWIQEFLNARCFAVKVNNYITEWKKIETGVPKGAVLSPLLFSIYINDIPIKYDKNHSYSLLFADDLVTFFIYKKDKKIDSKINDYNNKLKKWLDNWQLKMHPEKCNYMIFNKGAQSKFQEQIKIKLFNAEMPSCKTIKFLGIVFDIGMNF